MATLATTNIKHASSSSNNIVLNSSGTTQIPGHIIQVVQGQTTTENSNTTITMADTGLSLSITPHAASSKILAFVTQSARISMTTAIGGGFQLLRDSTVVHKAAPVSTDGTNNVPVQLYFANFASNANFYFYHNMHFLDSPSYSLGSSLTYKTQMAIAIAGSGRTIYAQPDGTDTNGISTITLMEVAT